jgi:hypothetical protein
VFEEKNGNLLVSARDMHAALELDRRTGKILWRLGGKNSDFKMTGNSQFLSQHRIARVPDGRITVFDNGAPPYPGRPARGLVLSVSGKTVKTSRSLQRSSSLLSPSQGNVQGLPNGNFMVGWGGKAPFFTEFTSKGKIALDAQIKPVHDSYRVWRFPWTAQPTAPPDVAAKNIGGKTHVFASWNGATEVAQWRVLTAGPPVTAVRKGFETEIVLSGKAPAVSVQALDKNGAPLGGPSRTVSPSG